MREPPPTARELAARMLACEGLAAPHAQPQAAPHVEPRAAPHAPTLAAVNGSLARLHRELEPLVGDVGFRALLSRALALAKREADWLDGVTIGPDGSLQGFEETQPANAPDDRARAAAALLAQALGLLVTFVGEDLTARLVTKACPETQGQDAGARVEEKSK